MKKQINKGFSIVEILFALLLSGIILIVVCGVFLYGLQGIKRGRLRSTALNIADKKITQIHNLMHFVQTDTIDGDKLYSIMTGGDTNVKTFTIGGEELKQNEIYEIWPYGGITAKNIDIEGTVTVNATADYTYKLHMEDYNYSEGKFLKKVKIDIFWKEKETGAKSIFLETLISKQDRWPGETPVP